MKRSSRRIYSWACRRKWHGGRPSVIWTEGGRDSVQTTPSRTWWPASAAVSISAGCTGTTGARKQSSGGARPDWRTGHAAWHGRSARIPCRRRLLRQSMRCSATVTNTWKSWKAIWKQRSALPIRSQWKPSRIGCGNCSRSWSTWRKAARTTMTFPRRYSGCGNCRSRQTWMKLPRTSERSESGNWLISSILSREPSRSLMRLWRRSCWREFV